MSALAAGWDDEDESQPVYPENLVCARRALELLLTWWPAVGEPELGAVPDGRLDLSWRNNRDFTLDLEGKEPRIPTFHISPAHFTLDLEDKELRTHARASYELHDRIINGADTEERAHELAAMLCAELM